MNYLYVIGPTAGPVKIGFSVNPVDRLYTIRNAAPMAVEMHVCYEVGHLHREIERTVHLVLREKRLRGEWFDVNAAAAIGAIQKTVELVGVTANAFDIRAPVSTVAKVPKVLDPNRRPVGRPSSGKKVITIRFDPEVIEKFNAVRIRPARLPRRPRLARPPQIVEIGLHLRLDRDHVLVHPFLMRSAIQTIGSSSPKIFASGKSCLISSSTSSRRPLVIRDLLAPDVERHHHTVLEDARAATARCARRW